MKRVLLFAGVLIVGAALCFVVWKRSHRKPNVLFITIDTLRSDHCSSYGYHLKTTPNLDALAQEGVRIESAYAAMPTTGPSHSTMFTSLYPFSHGVIMNGHRLEDKFQTLAEILKDEGYETGAVVSSFAVSQKFGLSQGFESYDDHFDLATSSIRRKQWAGSKLKGAFDRRANKTTEHALKWLMEKKNDRPFFLWIHYFDPHGPYVPPEPYLSAFKPKDPNADSLTRTIGAYDGEINFADHEIGSVLQYIDDHDLAENTLIVVVGDHGEGLMQHGRLEHGIVIYEEAVRVPLIFRWRNHLPAGKVLPGPFQLVDLTPTLLGLARLRANTTGFEGVNQTSLLLGQTMADPDRAVYLQRRYYNDGTVDGNFVVYGEKLGIVQMPWKYIEADKEGTRELYNLQSDPHELTNIVDQNPNKAKELATLLRNWRAKYKTNPAQSIPEEDKENLKTLGYVQ